MKIKVTNGVFVFKPETSDEESWLESLEFGKKLEYDGRSGNEEDIFSFSLSFNNFSIFAKSSMEDNNNLRRLRDGIFFSRYASFYLWKKEEGAYFFNLAHCKICGKPIAYSHEVEWAVCDECEEKCEHEPTEGLIHGAGKRLTFGKFCKNCGRVLQPEELINQD